MKKPESMVSGLTVTVEVEYRSGEVEVDWYMPDEWDKAVSAYETLSGYVGGAMVRVALRYLDETLAEYTEEEEEED